MKIAVYSPYLDTIGGGEKYVLTIAEYLSKNHNVDFLLGTHLYNQNINKLLQKTKDLHDLDLSKVNFIKAPIGARSSFLERLFFLQKYDFLFYLSDGSIFLSSAKNSIIHLQSPIINKSNNPWEKIKLSSWKLIIYNSKFTKEETKNSWKKPGLVIYPPVLVEEIKPLKKKKQIVSVGRFFGYLKDKKHSLLIDAFKKLVIGGNLSGWSLHLAGGAGEGDQAYIDQLRVQAKDLKVNLVPNMPFNQLKKLYGESQIYWHASGYGEKDPTKMEHFGISTVEAMAGGCVPVVINLGGQKEIVENNKSGFLWNSVDELIKYTIDLIENENLRKKLTISAQDRSKIFSKENFCKKIQEIINGNS